MEQAVPLVGDDKDGEGQKFCIDLRRVRRNPLRLKHLSAQNFGRRKEYCD